MKASSCPNAPAMARPALTDASSNGSGKVHGPNFKRITDPFKPTVC